jgi:hypothetical protein
MGLRRQALAPRAPSDFPSASTDLRGREHHDADRAIDQFKRHRALAAGDEIFVVKGILVSSTIGVGVSSTSGVTVDNHGTIIGLTQGVYVGVGAGVALSTVINGADGTISNASVNFLALAVSGTHLITNYGQVTSPGGGRTAQARPTTSQLPMESSTPMEILPTR